MPAGGTPMRRATKAAVCRQQCCIQPSATLGLAQREAATTVPRRPTTASQTPRLAGSATNCITAASCCRAGGSRVSRANSSKGPCPFPSVPHDVSTVLLLSIAAEGRGRSDVASAVQVALPSHGPVLQLLQPGQLSLGPHKCCCCASIGSGGARG